MSSFDRRQAKVGYLEDGTLRIQVVELSDFLYSQGGRRWKSRPPMVEARISYSGLLIAWGVAHCPWVSANHYMVWPELEIESPTIEQGILHAVGLKPVYVVWS